MNTLRIATVLLLFSLLSLIITTASPAPPPPPGGCSDAVISISPCLPFISDPPNDLSTRPSSQCCDLFSASFEAGEAVCLCYLVRGSMLLGFPVNATKLLSLSFLCPSNNSRSSNATTSLRSICLGAQKLPPLMSTEGPDISRGNNSGSDNPSSPLTTTNPVSTNSSYRQPSSLPLPAAGSSPSQNNEGSHFLPGFGILLALILFFF